MLLSQHQEALIDPQNAADADPDPDPDGDPGPLTDEERDSVVEQLEAAPTIRPPRPRK